MTQKNFLTIGGLHGNEPLGVNLVPRIQALNLAYLQAEFGNPEAIKQNRRFVEQDLNRVFPGNLQGNLEQKRAAELMQICQSYDFVFDFHNTHCSGNDCGFVGGDNYEETLKLAAFLGLERVIVADYDCINKYVSGCLSVEISLGSSKNSVDYWLEKLQTLEKFEPKENLLLLKLFRFVYRVSRAEQNQFNFQNWQAFVPISDEEKTLLNLDLSKNYYPIFVDDEYTKEYNFAGLVSEL